MKIIFLFTACVILALSEMSLSCTIKCNYGISSPSMQGVGHIYWCYIANDPHITSKELAENCDISGTHQYSNTDGNVLGFYASKTINYFPHALSRTYQNIKLIVFQVCKMKEIHQSDLKPFPHLVHFSLELNDIEVIEQDLFKYNPNLEYLVLSRNNIVHIDSKVFDNLNKLRWIYLYPISCLMSGISVAIDSIEESKKVVALVNSNCSSSEFLSIDNQLKNLEVESKSLNCEDFAIKMENFTSIYKQSKLSKSRTLNDKFLALTNSKECPNHQQIIKLLNLDKKVSKIETNFSNGQKIILEKFEILKPSQCDLNNHFDEFKTSQNLIRATLSEISSSTANHEIKLDQIQTRVLTSIEELTASQKTFNKLQNSKLNKLHSDLKSHKSSPDDLSVLQTKLQDTLDTTGQSLEYCRTFKDHLTTSITDQGSLIDEKLENFENNLFDIINPNTKKLEEIQKELDQTTNKILVAVDEKLIAFENRLIDRFEKALDLKLENN